MKQCQRCDRFLDPSAFYPSERKKIRGTCRECKKLYTRKWRARNVLKSKAHDINSYVWHHYPRKRRQRISEEDMQVVRAICNGMCARCGLATSHVDHIQPLIKGGRNVRENLQLMCKKCNDSKGRWRVEDNRWKPGSYQETMLSLVDYEWSLIR